MSGGKKATAGTAIGGGGSGPKFLFLEQWGLLESTSHCDAIISMGIIYWGVGGGSNMWDIRHTTNAVVMAELNS